MPLGKDIRSMYMYLFNKLPTNPLRLGSNLSSAVNVRARASVRTSLSSSEPPEEAPNVAEVWRQKQLEYTFRLTAMERYEDFAQVTRKALDYALAATGQELAPEQKDELMAQYNDLERFADVEPGLSA
jgi:hypothetical protein